jgi:hypothetical protein
MELDINQALHFLDMLEYDGRHTIASENPFGRDNLPVWETGRTYEAHQRELMIADIKKRQARKSNVYYSVNKPCMVTKRQGSGGKNNIDDIIAIRALAFDIDFTSFQRDNEAILEFIDKNLTNELMPSLVINTGGGFHLIYLLDKRILTDLYKPPKTDEEEKVNEIMIANRYQVTALGHDFEAMLRYKFEDLPVKIDNMSNIDRVMRLPGTINTPKAEKQEKGQVPALAHIAIDYHHKCNISKLRELLPKMQAARPIGVKQPFIPRKNSRWTAYMKAYACIEFIRDQGLADTNEWYTYNVMLPLIGCIHDDNIANQLTIDEATELFLEAVSGGARYGIMGRGQGYFMRQWKSHRPEIPRHGTKSMGGLIYAAQQNGFKLPWIGEVMWESDYLKQKEELERKKQSISQVDKDLFG